MVIIIVNNLIEILSSLSEQERQEEILIEGSIYSDDWEIILIESILIQIQIKRV